MYCLDFNQVWVDVSEFDRHYRQGLLFEQQKQQDAAIHEFAAAEGLYRDDFLIDDLYDEWAIAPRERLKDQYLQVETKLSRYCLEAGDLDGCIAHCHAVLTREPCREDAYQRLIRCHLIMGHRRRALNWYQRCETILRDELGVPPSRDTRLLISMITESDENHARSYLASA
jgi:DNA-binding SARP family transcriptional activator